jgi:hypothetical protein
VHEAAFILMCALRELIWLVDINMVVFASNYVGSSALKSRTSLQKFIVKLLHIRSTRFFLVSYNQTP